jgi:spermidine synthase
MARPWKTLEEIETNEGKMVLLQRGPGDFIIRMNEYVLMNSRLNLTELALGKSAVELLAAKENLSVLIGGLGMGYTLRATLDALPQNASVRVGELNPTVVAWCKEHLRGLTSAAVEDPRVDVVIGDVALLIQKAATVPDAQKYNAIILDLYQGTHDARTDPNCPFYGRRALESAHEALRKNGVFAAWTEQSDDRFQKRLTEVGFDVRLTRPGKGGPRHAVYLGRKKG